MFVLSGQLRSLPVLLSIFNSLYYPSAKFSRAIDNHIAPLISPGGKYDGKIKVVFRLQVQPWHASSTLTHEAGLAVLKASPDKFWTFSRLVRELILNHSIPRYPVFGYISFMRPNMSLQLV